MTLPPSMFTSWYFCIGKAHPHDVMEADTCQDDGLCGLHLCYESIWEDSHTYFKLFASIPKALSSTLWRSDSWRFSGGDQGLFCLYCSPSWTRYREERSNHLLCRKAYHNHRSLGVEQWTDVGCHLQHNFWDQTHRRFGSESRTHWPQHLPTGTYSLHLLKPWALWNGIPCSCGTVSPVLWTLDWEFLVMCFCI